MSDAPGSGFGKFVPGFEFLQNLAGQAAGGVAQGLGNSLPQMPNLSHWVAPTFNVEELDKRIEELKAVHYWLDQNAKALGATVQALEVQKMTLATLQNMNFSLGDVANALKIKAVDTVSGLTGAKHQFAGLEVPPRTYGKPAAPPEAEPEADEPEEVEPEAPPPASRSRARTPAAAAPSPAGGVVDPLQWWGALSQQFQTIATNAMKDVAQQTALDTTRQVASGLTEQAVKTATGVAGKAAGSVARNVGTAVGMGQAAARAVAGAARPASAAQKTVSKKAAAKKAPARKPAAKPPAPRKAPAPRAPVQTLSPGDWTLPTAFFPGLQAVTGAAPGTQPATRKAAPKAAKKTATPRRPR
jgi:hypothetical protein